MAIDRKLWQSPLYHYRSPPWPCPRCGPGTLKQVTGTWQARVAADLKRPDAYDPDHEYGAATCLLECNRDDCEESCSVAGSFGTEIQLLDGEPSSISVFTPKMIDPAPPIIRLPTASPDPVRLEARRAFSLFWADHAACLNSIRHAIELFLTDVRIPKSHKVAKSTGGRKLVRWNLHDRIELLRKNRHGMDKLCDGLLAVKHLGNAGSHPGDVTAEDALDGFEILEEVLVAVYGDAGRLDKTIKEINKRRGPRRRKA